MLPSRLSAAARTFVTDATDEQRIRVEGSDPFGGYATSFHYCRHGTLNSSRRVEPETALVGWGSDG
jgi:hypothetical protein